MHDKYRMAKDGRPTFDRVFAAAELLHKHEVRFNSLTVVNRINARYPQDVYRFLRREVRPYQMQFLPCVEPKVFRQTAPERWDLDTEKVGLDFVNLFETAVAQWMGTDAQICAYHEVCGKGLALPATKPCILR